MLEADFADSYHGTRGKLKYKGGESRGRWVTGNGKVKGDMHKHLQFTRDMKVIGATVTGVGGGEQNFLPVPLLSPSHK